MKNKLTINLHATECVSYPKDDPCPFQGVYIPNSYRPFTCLNPLVKVDRVKGGTSGNGERHKSCLLLGDHITIQHVGVNNER